MTQDIARQLDEIVLLLEQNPGGLSRGEIAGKLSFSINSKTLQRRLASLCELGRASASGDRRATKYFPAAPVLETGKAVNKDKVADAFTSKSLDVLKFLDTPSHSRPKVSYNREFLDSYVPNDTEYVPKDRRAQLAEEGKRFDEALAAGTYARQICQRLLIDLSYNSSRLEGNTYSILDTRKLIEDGVTADGKVRAETVMIMNHKEAILFLVEDAQDIELDIFTILNLHNLLSQDLLANPASCGKIRTIAVHIGGSAYQPLNNPHLLRELLEQILIKARAINDPFEQSFFVLIHLSYLQAFEDVNKRTSRMACNVPFIKNNLCPLSFVDVSQDDYTRALLAVYEKNNVKPMLDLFVWAYLRSCNQYGVVKQSIGEIDAFRIQYRPQRKEVMGRIVRDNLHGNAIEQYISQYCAEHHIENKAKFIAMTLADLDALHVGAIVGLGVSENQLNIWMAGKKPGHSI